MFWARPSDQKDRSDAAGVEVNAPVGEVGRSSRRAGVVPLRPDLPVGDWAALPACRFRLLGRALAWKPVPERPGFYEPARESKKIRGTHIIFILNKIVSLELITFVVQHDSTVEQTKFKMIILFNMNAL